MTEDNLELTDSTETIERQCLKSILKRISADIEEVVDNKKDLKKLMRSPTVEGKQVQRLNILRGEGKAEDTTERSPGEWWSDNLVDW